LSDIFWTTVVIVVVVISWVVSVVVVVLLVVVIVIIVVVVANIHKATTTIESILVISVAVVVVVVVVVAVSLAVSSVTIVVVVVAVSRIVGVVVAESILHIVPPASDLAGWALNVILVTNWLHTKSVATTITVVVPFVGSDTVAVAVVVGHRHWTAPKGTSLLSANVSPVVLGFLIPPVSCLALGRIVEAIIVKVSVVVHTEVIVIVHVVVEAIVHHVLLTTRTRNHVPILSSVHFGILPLGRGDIVGIIIVVVVEGSNNLTTRSSESVIVIVVVIILPLLLLEVLIVIPIVVHVVVVEILLVVVGSHSTIVLVCSRIAIVGTEDLGASAVFKVARIAIIIFVVTTVVVVVTSRTILLPLFRSNVVSLRIDVGNWQIVIIAHAIIDVAVVLVTGIDTSIHATLRGTIVLLFFVPPSSFCGLGSFIVDGRRSSKGVAIAITTGSGFSDRSIVTIVAVPSMLLKGSGRRKGKSRGERTTDFCGLAKRLAVYDERVNSDSGQKDES